MKIEAKIMNKTYCIDCGDGRQKVYWIASAACSLFGQDHYPSGIYVPYSLLKVDEDYCPHPQLPIHKIFQDGDKVEVTVKDCSRDPTTNEKQWYEQAFGKERNIMKVNLIYYPKADIIKNTKSITLY
jgi:hypothetical protein